MSKLKKKIIIASGGTGGHMFPASSLANYLKSIDYKVILTSDGNVNPKSVEHLSTVP